MLSILFAIITFWLELAKFFAFSMIVFWCSIADFILAVSRQRIRCHAVRICIAIAVASLCSVGLAAVISWTAAAAAAAAAQYLSRAKQTLPSTHQLSPVQIAVTIDANPVTWCTAATQIALIIFHVIRFVCIRILYIIAAALV